MVGSKNEIDWFETTMEERYAITKRGRLGSDSKDDKELTLLNRVVRWVDGVGIEVEADPRQAERLVAQLGLTGSNPVGTPGVRPTTQELEEDDVIHDTRSKVYQASIARGNYMGPDRPEIGYAVKECCRRMSQHTPSTGDPAPRRWGSFGAAVKTSPERGYIVNVRAMPTVLQHPSASLNFARI